MNKSDRMQLKAVCVIFGIVVLLVAAFSLVIKGNKKEEMEEKQPVITHLYYTYVTEISDAEISIFDGQKQTFECNSTQLGISKADEGQVCNLTLTDGIVTAIEKLNDNKINEKVISVESNKGIVLEKSGYIACADNMNIYLLYGEMRTGTFSDIRIGYSFADFVIKDGEICAILITRDESMETIRVLIKNSDYKGNYHESIQLTCDADYRVSYLENGVSKEDLVKAGEPFTINGNSDYLKERFSRIYIVPSVLTAKISLLSVNRTQGVPGYRGIMEISKTEDGLVIINEVLLEEYLYSVVPSEMPSGYPKEALKAQAVCARTYAYSHMLSPGLPDLGAHVDDSTGYQVYNNISDQSTTTDAVKETAGQVLYSGNSLVNTFYYSTSCGYGSDEHVWKSDLNTEYEYLNATSISAEGIEGETTDISGENITDEATFVSFIKGSSDHDFERNEPWYRWTYNVNEISSDQILSLLQDRFGVNPKLILTLEKDVYISKPVDKLGNIKSIYVNKRNAGGVCDELIIEGEENTYKVISEFNIRYVLCNRTQKVTRQDGSAIEMNSILPSAFFVIEPVLDDNFMVGYHLYGGGFGHGAGMSQNGAKNMAEVGYSATQILEFFFRDSTVRGVK